MPRITPLRWKVLDCIVLACGFTFSRQDGSHRIYSKEGCIRPLVIPAHSKDLAVSIILSNLKSAGISRDDFFKYLKGCS